jgi:hypothetical protein
MRDAAAIERDARALLSAGRLEEAEALIRPYTATGVAPMPIWRLLVQAIRPLGRIAEARTIQEMLVDAFPGDFAIRYDLAETLLLLGEFDRGWREYQYRYSLPHTARIERKVQKPRWDGRSIPGQTLLIHDEQGYGDTFQFMRMAPWAKRRSGARVIVEINPESEGLARRIEGIDGVSVRGQLPPPFDLHCEMMTLPMVLKLQMSDLPGTIPYLSPSPGHLRTWTRRLSKHRRPLIALVWAGRPTHPNDANRSISLAALAPLASIDATFLVIQKGRVEQAETPPKGMNLVALNERIDDFEDTAAILSIADLLISVDSSPVHLAGALGRLAWVMLPYVPDWRWLLNRDDTPWYPSVRLFRQSSRGDWQDVVERVGQSLIEWQIGWISAAASRD